MPVGSWLVDHLPPPSVRGKRAPEVGTMGTDPILTCTSIPQQHGHCRHVINDRKCESANLSAHTWTAVAGCATRACQDSRRRERRRSPGWGDPADPPNSGLLPAHPCKNPILSGCCEQVVSCSPSSLCVVEKGGFCWGGWHGGSAVAVHAPAIWTRQYDYTIKFNLSLARHPGLGRAERSMDLGA